MLHLLAWIVIGALAGWVASLITGKSTDFSSKVPSFFENAVVGIVGAVLGGWVVRALGDNQANDGWVATFFTAVLGAVILLFVAHAITARRNRNV